MSDIVERLRELLAKATPGPWCAVTQDCNGDVCEPEAILEICK